MSKPIPVVTRVFMLQDGKVYLLLRNGKNSSTTAGGIVKRWIAPGGMVDPGENALQGAIREVEEETGVTIDPKDMVMFFEKYDPVFCVNMVFYRCHKWDGTVTVKEPEKFDRVEWVYPEDAASLEKPGEHVGVFILEALRALQKPQAKNVKRAVPIFANW